MLHRRVRQAAVQRAVRWAGVPLTACRVYHMPGWKTKVSTKDARTREQREADRKARQIEKLPRPEALHDFQYPYEKTVLSDYMFQYPVYENELDTPHLFNLTPPPNFFLYWNVSHFDRTDYPAVPAEDHRRYVPSPSSPRWSQHRTRMLDYFRKHQLCPHYLPHVNAEVNMSVVFPGRQGGRHGAMRSAEQEGDAASASTMRNVAGASEGVCAVCPVKELTRDNFWLTAHCGNYMELADVQAAPTIFLYHADCAATRGNGHVAEAAAAPPRYYTMMMVSPDYPYRVPPHKERDQLDRGFFLHYMVANLTSRQVGLHAGSHSRSTARDAAYPTSTVDSHLGGADCVGKDDAIAADALCAGAPTPSCMSAAADWHSVTHTAGTHVQQCDVVIPYVPPLPTEYAGTVRLMCVLYEQSHLVHVKPLTTHEERTDFPLVKRSNYRIHAASTGNTAGIPDVAHGAQPASLASLRALERSWSDIPSALTFFQTAWDIQVQEFYERVQLPEPALPHDEETEALLEFHARRPEELRVRSRHRADGSTNMGDENSNFWMQALPTHMTDGSMQSRWSRRTAMGANGVPVIYPHAATHQK